MRAAPENYKGIEYVQISSLPAEQKEIIYSSLHRKLIITIMKGDVLLNDCLQYHHYTSWYENIFAPAAAEKIIEVKIAATSLALAFK